MKAIVYRIELLEPVLVSDIEGDPNTAAAFDHLPGGALRGAFVGRYLIANAGADLAADATARRLFFDGRTRYLNGYRLDRLGQRSLPTPRSWQRNKNEKKTVYDFARDEPDEDDVKWQAVSKPFCFIAGRSARLIERERRISVHTARTRRFGRAMPEESIDKNEGDQLGAVYRYDALAAGQTFEAVILCEDGDEAALKQFIEGEIKLGKSRTGGYGRARLSLSDHVNLASPWREYDSDEARTLFRRTQDYASRDAMSGNQGVPDARSEEVSRETARDGQTQTQLWPVPNAQLTVTLLSDAILRDGLGQHVIDPKAMRALLERELDCRLERPRAFLAERVAGGFNRKWGLPLPQSTAIVMGSVFVYEVAALNRANLDALLERGIGERRSEGFGRLAINWQTEEKLTVDPTEAGPSGGRAEPLTGVAEATARLMAERLLRRKLDRKVVELANRVGQGRGKPGVMDKPPRNSQLARLRAVIHEALRETPPDPEKIRSYLQDIGERAAARRQFERARVARHNLRSWLEAVLQQSNEAAWRKLFDIRDADLRGVGGIKPRLSEQLRHEYLLRFIDAVLARAAKQAREEEQS